MAVNAPRVLNRRVDGFPPGSVYVGRPSYWGNPFTIGARNGWTREAVIKKFEQHITSKLEFINEVRLYLGQKDLVCWCAPKPCHADVLLRIANER